MVSKKWSKKNARKYSETSSERDKPMCSIVWIVRRDCSDLINGKCKWVKE